MISVVVVSCLQLCAPCVDTFKRKSHSSQGVNNKSTPTCQQISVVGTTSIAPLENRSLFVFQKVCLSQLQNYKHKHSSD